MKKFNINKINNESNNIFEVLLDDIYEECTYVSGATFPNKYGECRRQEPSSLANKSPLIILK